MCGSDGTEWYSKPRTEAVGASIGDAHIGSYWYMYVIKMFSHAVFKKVQVGKDHEKAQSEKDSHSKNRDVQLFPNWWPLSYTDLTKYMKNLTKYMKNVHKMQTTQNSTSKTKLTIRYLYHENIS